MEKLLAKGLCVSIPGKMKRYAASDPWFLREKMLKIIGVATEAELENLEKKRKEILERNKSFQENIDSVASELEPIFARSRTDGSPLDYIEIVKSPAQIHRRFIELVSSSTNEVLAFVKPPYSGGRELLDEQLNEEYTQLDRGVKVKGIYEIAESEEERIWQHRIMESASKKGEEVRVYAYLPLKMAIFDEKVAIFTLEDPVLRKISVTTLVIEHHALAISLKMFFEMFWDKAEDYNTIKKGLP
jgi:sugar-specific transcriptional regulator TrmB